MKTTRKPQDDTESILIALDQVSQTIDVLSSTVNRLKERVVSSLNRQLMADNSDEAGGHLPCPAPTDNNSLH